MKYNLPKNYQGQNKQEAEKLPANYQRSIKHDSSLSRAGEKKMEIFKTTSAQESKFIGHIISLIRLRICSYRFRLTVYGFKNSYLAIAFFLLLCFSAQVFAQQLATSGYTPPGLQSGAPAGSYALSNIDNVNFSNGNLNVSIPLLQVGGRGSAGYPITLPIEHKWLIHHVRQPIPPYYPNPSYQDHYYPDGNSANTSNGFGPGVMKSLTYSTIPQTCPNSNPSLTSGYVLTRMMFTGPDGTQLEFYDQRTGGTPAYYGVSSPCSEHPDAENRGKIWVTGDGSNVTFVTPNDFHELNMPGTDGAGSPSGDLLFPNGTKYHIEQGNVTYITDRNGNKTVLTYGGTGGPVSSITDSMGRVISVSPQNVTNNTPATISFNGTGGATRTIKIGYDSQSNLLRSDQTAKSNHDLFPELGNDAGPDIVNPQRVAYVELPDGRRYNFKYNSYGDVARIELPTGGAFEYEWSGIVQTGANLGVIARWITEKRIYPNGGSGSNYTSKTKYEYTNPANPGIPQGEVKVTEYEKTSGGDNPLAVSKHYVNSQGVSSYPDPLRYWVDGSLGKETKTESYDATGNTLLRKVENDYEFRASVGGTAAAGGSYTHQVDYRPIRSTATLADVSPNLVSKQEFAYDPNVSYNSQTDVYEYDYGSGTAGSFRRRSHTDYVTDPNYINSTGAYLRELSLQTWVSSDAAGTSKVSLSQMEYDNYASDINHAGLVNRANIPGFDGTNYGTGNAKRGNATAITSYADAAAQTGAVKAYSQYDILGNVVKTIDSKGNASTVSYDDNFGAPDGEARTNSAPAQLSGSSTFAFATSATNPAGFTIHAQFDYFTGAAVDAEDINGTVSSSFHNDPLDRPTQAVTASNVPALKQQTTIAYDDTNHKVTTTSDLNTFGDNSLKAESYYDGLGRTTESRKYEAGGGYISTLTEYDALSRVKRVTNPYRPLQSEPQVWTTSAYDALGRVTSVTTPDNAVVQMAYSGNAVTGTDQAGKQRRSIINALGQLTRVDEPDDSGNLGTVANPNQPTNYLYNTLGKMVKATQGIQSRYFKYDSLSRLLRVRQPEQGTNAGLALTDAVTGNSDWSAGFTYDANGNMLTATDTKGTIITNSYDNLNRSLSRTYSDGTPTVTYTYDDSSIQYSKGHLTKTSNSVSTSQILSLDAVGKILLSRQTTDGQNYDSAYTYNLANALLEETYPSGRKVKNTLATDGNLSKIETMPSGGVYATRADNLAYSSAGAISQLKFGSGKWESAQFNNRLQVTQLGLGTSATDTSLWKLNYDFGTTDNNGNIKQQTTTVPSINPLVQTYTYDSLNRLKSATETQNSTQTFKQTFIYDRYGNRNFDTANTTTLGSCPASQCNPTFDANTNRITSSGYIYDLAGNVITDAQGRQFTFNGDNKQTQVKDSANNVIGIYSYDGDGKRIKKVTNSEATTFVYSGGKLVAEYLLTTATPQIPRTQYITTDILGSPRIISDGSGNIVSRRDFMPFGEELNEIGNRSASAGYNADSVRQKFTGYQRDAETNLDFAEARYYNNQNGRFTVVDPLLASGKSANPQTFNRYTYALNSPLKLIDRSGAFPEFTFSVFVRAFAPYTWFGPGNVAMGDGRGFSTDPSASYRIQSYSEITTTDDGAYFPESITRASAPTTSVTNLGVFGVTGIPGTNVQVPAIWSANSETYIDDPNGNYFSDGLPGGSSSLSYHMYGNDDAVPIISPNIDLHPDFHFAYADQGNGIVNMTVTGTVTGDQFPAAESFIRDANGNSVMLGIFAPSTNSGPTTSLPLDRSSPMINVNVTVQVNNGVFQGVVENGTVVPLDEYNRRFTSQPAIRPE